MNFANSNVHVRCNAMTSYALFKAQSVICYGLVAAVLLSSRDLGSRALPSRKLVGARPLLSTLLIARVGAFFRILRDLQDCHTFAPLESENLSKNSSNFLAFFENFFEKSLFFNIFFIEFSTDSDQILSEFRQII